MKRELYLPYFKGKRVTVMGLGLLGRGVGDTAFLASVCGEVIVTDKKTSEELKESVDVLKDCSNIIFNLGKHDLKDFENRDFILKAAGVPLESEFINHARDEGVPVYMSAALVVKIIKEKLQNVKVIGVTGTRGKSTATHLIEHILKESGKRVHIGGNVRGVANLPLLNEIEDGDYLVLELDSWQLQGFGDFKISPGISLFTSFLDDHLNYYHNDREIYFKDKANIFLYQKDGDVCIGSRQAQEEILKRGDKKIIVPEVVQIDSNLIGVHNDVAISLAIEVVIQCGIKKEEAIKAIKSFKAVDGRLQYLGEYRNVKVFNDNNGTTPEAVIVGLDAIEEKFKKKPILIVGGADKGLNLSELEKAILNKTKDVVYLSGEGTNKISLDKKYEFEKLENCVDKSFELSQDGDIIIFSPGFSSKSKYFNNEYERNDLFVTCIERYNI